jgi:hypothetical protein
VLIKRKIRICNNNYYYNAVIKKRLIHTIEPPGISAIAGSMTTLWHAHLAVIVYFYLYIGIACGTNM